MNQQQSELLTIKQTIFEHFIFPYKVNPQCLSLINSPYITQEQFREITAKSLPSSDADLIFMFLQLALNMEGNGKPVELQSMKIYLALQNFNQAARHGMFENANISDVKYQERIQKQMMNNYSPLNSPRAKTMRVQSQQNEQQQTIQFVRNSFKDFLTLLSNNEDTINVSEFQYLQLFLDFSAAAIFDRTTKLNSKLLTDYAIKHLQCSDTFHLIQGFTKSVTIKQKLPQNDLKISQCEDSMIFIDCAVNTLSIQQCTNCQIFVSAVRSITTLSSCEKTTVCVASNYLRISNSVDTTVHYFGSYAPIIYGDCRNIVLAPHSANVAKILERLKEAQIPISKANRDRFSKPIVMGSSRIDWTLLMVEDISKFALPEEPFSSIDSSLILECNFDIERMAKEITEKRILAQPMNMERIVLPLLAPPEYVKSVYERFKYFGNLQQQLKQSGIRDELLKGFQNAIQGNFREWLVTTGAIKGISDLVKLIDQDQ